MSKNKEEKSILKMFIKKSIIVLSAALFLVIIILLSKIESLAEFMTRTVSRFLIMVMGKITSLFTASVFEILIIVSIIAVLTGVVLFFVRLKRRGKRSLLKLLDVVAIVLCVVIFYQVCVGFAYYRAPLDLSASLRDIDDSYAEVAVKYFTDDFVEIANTISRDENGYAVSPYNKKELNSALKKEFERLNNGYFSSFTPKYKEVKCSFVMAELGIVGVFFGPLGESNVTNLAFDYQVPMYAAHEISHAKGIMRESEAELAAMYLMLSSDDPYFRYSAYMSAYFRYILSSIYSTNNDLYNELLAKIPSDVFKEISDSRKIYEKYNHLSNLGEIFNDFYLRLNGQDDGTGSYNDYGTDVEVEPTDPGEPPVYIHSYSFTEKMLLSVCPI